MSLIPSLNRPLARLSLLIDRSATSPASGDASTTYRWGLLCGLLAAVSYTAASWCQRHVAATCDPLWVTWMRASVPAVILLPWVASRTVGRAHRLPTPRLLLELLGASLLVQFGGNLMYQKSLQLVGMTVAVPVAFGLMLVASALLGWAFLREAVGWRTVVSIALVILSLLLLAAGVAEQSAVGDGVSQSSLRQAGAGVAVALIAGACFAVSTLVVRRATTASVPPTTVVFIVTATGLVALGAAGLWQQTAASLLHAPPADLAVMFGGGLFNLIGFVAFSTALRLTTLVSANLVNASQVAMSALVGVCWCQEPLGWLLAVGLALNVLGTLCITRIRKPDARSLGQ